MGCRRKIRLQWPRCINITNTIPHCCRQNNRRIKTKIGRRCHATETSACRANIYSRSSRYVWRCMPNNKWSRSASIHGDKRLYWKKRISVKRWNSEGKQEFAYRRESKYRGWNGYNWGSKFREFHESPRMRKYRWVSYQWINNGNNIISHLHPSCIKDLMDHIISEGNRISANTPRRDTSKIKRRRADTESEKKPPDCTARKYRTTTPQWSILTSWLKIWRKGKAWVTQ